MDEYISASKYYKQDTRVQNGTHPQYQTYYNEYIQYSSGKRTHPPPPPPPPHTHTQKKNKKKTLYPEYRRFADFPKTLGKQPNKRNIQWTTLASPRKVCVRYAKLCEVTRNRNIVPGDNISAKLCEIPRRNLTKYQSFFLFI